MLLGSIVLNSVLSLVAGRFFGITYHTYELYSLDNVKEVGTVRMLPATGICSTDLQKALFKRHSLKCNRLCALNEKCASSVAWEFQSVVTCHLLAENLCLNPQLNLKPINYCGVQLFDKIPDTQVQSCNEECIVKNPGNCSACQRPGCSGVRCEICSTSCSQCQDFTYQNSSLTAEVECVLWLGPKNIYETPANCLGSKMLLYSRFAFPDGTSNDTGRFPWMTCNFMSDKGNNFLDIELYSDDGTLYTTTYSGFTCSGNKSMSVRALVSGLDGLGAPILAPIPFVDTAALYHPSCGAFWRLNSTNFNFSIASTPYGSGPCPGLSTAFFGIPSNATQTGEFTSGIAWAALPNVKLTGIKIYMY